MVFLFWGQVLGASERKMPFKNDNEPWNKGVGNGNARKHGLNTFKRLLEDPKIDGRSSLYKVLRDKEIEFITALGGDPSPQEKFLIADTVRTMLYIGTLDEYAMALDAGIIRSGKVIPVIEARTQLPSHARRNLEALGLDRKVKAISLQEILDRDDSKSTGKPEGMQ